MEDQKYIVFKRDEFNNFLEWLDEGDHHSSTVIAYLRDPLHSKPLEDAVVIRTGDVFAHAGLEGYANCARLYAGAVSGMIHEFPADKRAAAQAMVDRLQDVVGYFMECAQEAEDRLARGDVKVPD